MGVSSLWAEVFKQLLDGPKGDGKVNEYLCVDKSRVRCLLHSSTKARFSGTRVLLFLRYKNWECDPLEAEGERSSSFT